MSSLADQLKVIKEKTASVVLDRKARSKIHSRSLIFDPKVASTQDYDYLYQLGLEGLDELSEIDSRFSKFRHTLFSETSVSMDRNVQTKDVISQLDKNIDAFLTLAGPFYSLAPTVKAVEWLVRRFHINMHNGEMLLLTSLPHYNQSVFVKILNVIPKNSFPKIFDWVVGYKDLLKNPPSSSILKAFHNDFEFFKLYAMFLVEQLKNGTVYQEQLSFFLSTTVQLLASLSKSLDTLNENHLPVVLEVVGFLLLPSKYETLRNIDVDTRLTAYSIIAVLASIIPISTELIRSFTESILQDPRSLEPNSVRQTLIVLSQLWRFYQGDFSDREAIVKCFANLAPSKLIKVEHLVKDLVVDNYKFQKFLTFYFFATFPNPESYKIFQLVDLGKSELYFSEIAKQIVENSTATDKCRSVVIHICEELLKSNSELFIKALATQEMNIDALEMKLMTTLGSNSSVRDSDDVEFDAGEEDNNDEETEEVAVQFATAANLDSIKSSSKSFFTSSSDSEFSKLTLDLISLLRNVTVKVQKSLLLKFTTSVFSSIETGISFLIRIAFTPSIPLSIRLTAIRCTKWKLKEASTSSSSPLDLYLLIPIFLLGVYDETRVVRAGFVQLLRFIKETTTSIHANKKKVKSVLFMEDVIYDTTEASKRAIISPNDALFFTELLLKEDVLEDVIIDRSRLVPVLFDGFFKSSKSGSKKFGQLILKTFVINQWSLNFFPVVFKWRAWNIVALENKNGTEDRFFFTDSDLSEYFTKRSNWIQQANDAKIAFFEEVEGAIVGLVGGNSTNEAKTATEVDWIIQSLNSQFSNLQIAVNSRLLEIFNNFSTVENRIKIVNKLIDLLNNDEPIESDPMDTLQTLKLDQDLFISVLGNVQIGGQIPEQGPAKRRRRSSSSTKQAMAREDINNMASTHLKKLTIILDLLEINLRNGTETIASPNLLQALFKILTDLDYLGNDGNLPVLYAQEALASCMILSIVKMKNSDETFKFDSNSIRADLIVNSIRSSQSPQVQNRLLLVIAELASLAPEIVLHSVMPIFTFMGAHTVRQDDEFSSSALQQTIAKVIPAVAANGSSSISNEIEFLLTSFVTAFQHIPRHRRVKLFTYLIRTLGSDLSLHVLLFLMGQQYCSSLNKNKMADAQVILEFTSSFLKSFSAIEQLEGISKFAELWDMIPIAELEANSEEYNKLSTRSIFGVSILSLTNSGLSTLRIEMLKYISSVVATENSNFDANTLKTKVAMVLLDSSINDDDEEKKSILGSFRNVAAFLLSSLDTFNNVSRNSEIALSLYDLLANFLNLLPIHYFVDSIFESLDVGKFSDTLSIKVAKNLVILAGAKFESELSSINIDEKIEESVLEKLLPVLLHGIKKNVDIELEQAYLDTFAIIVNKFGASTKTLATPTNSRLLLESLQAITSENCLLSESPETIISSINAITSIVNVLGVKTIGIFPKIVPPSLKIWETTTHSEDEESAKLIQSSIIVLLSCLIKKIPAFMTSSLDSIFITILSSDYVDNSIRTSVLGLVVEHMDSSQVLKSLCNIWCNKKFYENDNTGNIGLYLNTMQSTIDKIDKKSAATQSTVFIKWLIQAFEFRHYSEEADNKFDNNTIHRLESSFHSCGISYVMKLNDKKFRPLFATLVRWAVEGEGSNFSENTEVSRLVAFFKFFNKMQEQLKSIITSYFSYLLDPVASVLTRFSSGQLKDINLRRILLNSLTSSFKYDQDDYWSQQGRFDSICNPLLEQLTNIEEGIGKYLIKSITAFINNVASEEYNETLVHGLIKYISNEKEDNSSSTKIWTIRALKSIFQKMGEQWLTYLPTLIPYIAELLEDDDQAVEMEVRSGLVRVIENVLGEPLDRYLD